jgi:hypothetical protein
MSASTEMGIAPVSFDGVTRQLNRGRTSVATAVERKSSSDLCASQPNRATLDGRGRDADQLANIIASSVVASLLRSLL